MIAVVEEPSSVRYIYAKKRCRSTVLGQKEVQYCNRHEKKYVLGQKEVPYCIRPKRGTVLY